MTTLIQNRTSSSPASDTNRDLERRVALFIEQHQLSKGSRLTISADLGVVTLLGIVPTFHQRQLLHSLTRRVAGVIHIRDELEVAQHPRMHPATDRHST